MNIETKQSNKPRVNWIPLVSTNFFGELNNNFLKELICFIAVLWVAKEQASFVVALALGLLEISYIVFAPQAAYLAKRYNKVKVLQVTKILEIPIVLLASLGFVLQNIYIVFVALFLMGIQTSITAPANYALIKDIGGKKKFAYGTGLFEMTTVLGVITAGIIGGLLADKQFNSLSEYRLFIIFGILLVVSVTGYVTSKSIRAIESEPDHSPNALLFISSIIQSFKWSKQNLPSLNIVVIGISLFWLILSLLKLSLYEYCPHFLHMSTTQIGLLNLYIALALAAGYYTAGHISKNNINFSLVSFGGLGMGISLLLIYVLQPNRVVFHVLILIISFSAGLYQIPLCAWIQKNVAGRKLGEMIAYNNLMISVCILISSALFPVIVNLFSVNEIFLVASLLCFLCLALFYVKVPEITPVTMIFNKS